MSFEFCAESDPSQALITEVAALAPANPFQTLSYIEARRWLGAEPWVLLLRDDGKLASACAAFANSGYLNRSLEVTSLPSMPDREYFCKRLLEFCGRARFSYLDLNSYASTEATIPQISGEIRRRTRCEYILELQSPDLWRRLSSNHMRNIKRGLRAGLQVQRSVDDRACYEHARLVGASIGRRQRRGEAVQEDIPTRDFLAMTKMGAGQLFQAVLEGSTVSSALVLMSDKGAYYQSAGTSSEGMACGASHFLVCEIARILQTESKKIFNLGGTDQQSPGLERFKSGCGSTLVKLESAKFFQGSKWKRWLTMVLQSARRHRAHLRTCTTPR